MQVYCRLREIMRERPMTVEELHRMSGAGREAISALRGDKWMRVSRVALGKICGALNVTLDELFALNPDDIWASIRLAGEVTIHYGSRSLPEMRTGAASSEDSIMAGQYVGVWDLRAFKWISEYLEQSGCGVRVSLREHVTGAERGFDPSVRESAREIFENGNHIILGSPIANQHTEEVVCHAYGVPPYTPQKREAFPYGFVWSSRHAVISSFGWQGIGSQFGIMSNLTGELVAARTTVREGEGKDCALIVVYRFPVPPARRRHGSDKERVVICILGHSGAGTLAGAHVATDPRFAAALYPRERKVAQMRVVSATYTRAPTAALLDTRELRDAFLVQDSSCRPTTDEESPPARERQRHVRRVRR